MEKDKRCYYKHYSVIINDFGLYEDGSVRVLVYMPELNVALWCPAEALEIREVISDD